ncbi:hypothetical protein V1477_011077 [Vespula maculifrons]|uniref:Uncharacterized protein n=1 Tax=Vespula maculifrons TaxID=7453 RepID=A0ABD2C3R7_VESMC
MVQICSPSLILAEGHIYLGFPPLYNTFAMSGTRSRNTVIKTLHAGSLCTNIVCVLVVPPMITRPDHQLAIRSSSVYTL